MSNKSKYLVVTIKSWNIELFNIRLKNLPGEWYLISDPEKLSSRKVEEINPEKIFFIHWSEKVSAGIYGNYECIGFHETDLPFGRGGSPIQNLISIGIDKTKISAFRMGEIMDAGDIYLKKDLSLEGSAKEIFSRASKIIGQMITEIINTTIKPLPQSGEVTVFKRRKPPQSEIPTSNFSISKLYDHIRMLDAEGYPKAFLKYGNFKIEFENASLNKNIINANVRITIDKKND